MTLFGDICNEVQTAVVKTLSEDVEENWQLIVSQPFTLSNVLVKMDAESLIALGKCLLQDYSEANFKIASNRYVLDCQKLADSLLYNVIQKINKLTKRKRKHDEEGISKSFSANTFKAITDDMFFETNENTNSNFDMFIRKFNENLVDQFDNEAKVNKEKLQQLLNILEKLPIVYSSEQIQVVCLFYLIALLVDFKKSMNDSTRNRCEDLITG